MSVTNTRSLVETAEQLRELIPWPGKPVKKIESLERQSRNFIAHAPFLVTTMQRPDNLIEVRAYGGQPGFVEVLEDNTFFIPTTLDHAEGLAGCLFLIPGVNETLRVNGRVKFVRAATTASLGPSNTQVSQPNALAVEEVFMHCAKALIRSKLWNTEDLAGQPASLSKGLLPATPRKSDRLDSASRAFIEKSPFICLGTNLPDSGADVAPRGDPPGFVKILDDQTLLIPERRGNNLADNLTNMIANPWAGILFLVPGVEAELWVSGQARVTTEPALLERLTEQNKMPLVGIVVSITEVEFRPGSALLASRLWKPETKIDRKSFPTLGEIFRDQLATRGLPKEVTAKEIDESLAKDSVNNLY